jgi:Tfp pilus assembly protein PilO
MQGKRATLIVAAVAVVLAILMVVFLVLPKMNAVSAANTELETTKAQESTLLSQLAALQQAQDEAEANRKIIQSVEEQIPPTADEPGFLRLLSNAATRAGIKLWQFTPSQPVLNASINLSEIPVTFTVKGNYFALAEFLYNLETLPRVAKVQTVSITDAGTDAPDTSSSIPFLQATGAVILYTSDTSAGPGSVPGPSNGTSTSSPAPGA